MYDNQNEYIFCPYCGGVTRPGKCCNCGIDLSESASSAVNPQTAPPNPGPQMTYQQPNMNAGMGRPKQPNMNAGMANPQQPNANVGMNRPQQPNMNAGMGRPQQPNMNAGMNRPKQPQPAPKKKKSFGWIWFLVIGIIAVLAILLVVGLGIGAAFLIPTLADSDSDSTGYEPQSTITSTQPDSLYEPDADMTDVVVHPRDLQRLNLDSFNWKYYYQMADIYVDKKDGSNDIFLNAGYNSTFGTNHDNHSINEFTGEYFDPFVDCIDPSKGYGLSRHFIEYEDEIDGVTVKAYIAYIQLEGKKIPNESEINRQILNDTANDLFGHLSGQKPYPYECNSVTYMVDSYIPYNDGEKMSILLDVNIVQNDDTFVESYIYAINIDLVNGKILDNNEILNTDVNFAAMFRERCITQNGSDIDGLNYISDVELSEYLSNASTNVVFYSPYGVEVGYAYELNDGSYGSRGWMTITLSDYEQYLK